jgi:hypothetical protein
MFFLDIEIRTRTSGLIKCLCSRRTLIIVSTSGFQSFGKDSIHVDNSNGT